MVGEFDRSSRQRSPVSCRLVHVLRDKPFELGDEVVWRSRPGGDVGYVFACRVWVDDPSVKIIVQSSGSSVVHRVGQRGGPNGRSLLPGTWHGSRRQSVWGGLPTVRLHPVGRSYSVIRSWIADEQRFEGFYVNLAQPWARTSVGFDSRDYVLDVVAAADLSRWHLKDADELDHAVAVGKFTQGQAKAIHRVAKSAVDDLVARRWPFDGATWTQAVPQDLLRPSELPDQWESR